MSVLDKIKNLVIKMGAKGKIIGLTVLAVGNIASVVSISVAWFTLGGGGANIDMVSGDLNVEIRKVTAYKKIYPYYSNSAEFIDYNKDPTLKKYVIEDHSLVDPDVSQGASNLAYEQNYSVHNVTFTVDTSNTTLASYSTTTTDLSYSNICFVKANTEMKYYLVGDSTFSGDSHPWETEYGIPFSSSDYLNSEYLSITRKNVVLSAGASFILFAKNTVDEVRNECSYFTYSGTTANSPFRILSKEVSNHTYNCIQCLESGSYNFTFSLSYVNEQPTYKLNIALSNTQESRDSIISNNALDPTKVNIDYIGSTNKNNYPDINDYLPTAIYNQNTMMILDVELNYKNVNKVQAGLEVQRIPMETNKHLDGAYADGTKHLKGENSDPLKASDFYSFYSVFTKLPYGASKPTNGTNLAGAGYYSDPELTTPVNEGTADGSTVYYKDGSADMWDALHKRSDVEEVGYDIHVKHDGDWSDLPLTGRSSSGDGVNTEYYREGVYFDDGDVFNITMGENERNWSDVKAGYPAGKFAADANGDIEVQENGKGLYDIFVSVSPVGGKYITIQNHSTGILTLTSNDKTSTMNMTSKNIGTNNAEFYVKGVTLAADDYFTVTTNGNVRNWNDVKAGYPAGKFADNGGDNHEIKVVTAGTYDIYVSLTNNNGYITLHNHDTIEYVLNLTSGEDTTKIDLNGKNLSGDAEYYIENVFLEVGETFNVNLNGSSRGWSGVFATSSAYANFANDNGKIKVMVSDSYDISVKVTPDDGKSITIKKHGSSIFSKFVNKAGDYDTSVECTLHLKEANDSLIIDATDVNTDNIYHCYIGIEYDYAFSKYFLNENRLGKTYYLFRDYGFYFVGTQVLES